MAAFIGQLAVRNVKYLYHSGTKLQKASIRGNIYLVPQRCLHNSRRVLHILKKNPSLLLKNGHPPHICGLLAVRFNSSVPQPPESFPPGYIPDKPPVPLPDPDLTGQIELNVLGEPTLQSLGLGSNSPSGFFQQALDFLHVSLDCPWWMAIAFSTIFVRLCVFPLMVKSRINTTNMQNHMPTIQRLQQRVQEAKMTGDNVAVVQAYQELVDFSKRNKIKMGQMFLLPAVQIPIFISVFWGLKGMASLPIESMKTGGLFWFTDLTVPDPFYLLPLMTSATLLLTMELGVDSVQINTLSHVQKWMFRLMPIVLFPLMMNFPSAMLCYWFTSNMFSLCQAMFLKIPAVRQWCNIPTSIRHDRSMQAQKKPFVKGFKDSWEEQKMIARMKDRERVEREQWERSGKGPLVKTYKYNPVEQREKIKARMP